MSEPAVVVEAVGHHYGSRPALTDVSFEVPEASLFGLLGPNGSGKSTLLRILSTLVGPARGCARVLGRDTVADASTVRRSLGVVFQHPGLDGKLSVEENLTCHGHLYGLAGATLRARLEEVLERFDLVDRRSERTERLSGGLRRRVELAKALVVGARVLLLDEPSSGLDPTARREFLAHLRRLRDVAGMTAIVATHDLEEAESCDRVAVLDAGRVVGLGTPDELRAGVGGDVLVLRANEPVALRDAVRLRFGLELRLVDGTLRTERARGHELVRDLVEAFPERIRAITLGKPTLGDVFVRLTGHAMGVER